MVLRNSCLFKFSLFVDEVTIIVSLSSENEVLRSENNLLNTRYQQLLALSSDTDKAISKKYGVFHRIGGFAKRVTFLIDRDGVVRHIWDKVKITGHVEEIIAKIEALNL